MRHRCAGILALALLLLALPGAFTGAQEAGRPGAVNPLTGLTVADPFLLRLNPVIAKVSNAPAGVRPQTGLGAADLVFEHYAEGGLTRFSAIYFGQRPQRVGSIRSARLIDLELLPMFQGLLAWSGASNGVLARLNALAHPERLLRDALFRSPWYSRDPALPPPHNFFVNVAALSQLALNNGLISEPVLKGPLFLAEPPAGDAGSALLVELRYLATSVHWLWHADSGSYVRYTDGQPHLDATSAEALRAANVIALYADHRLTDIVESVWQGFTHFSIDIDLDSGGAGLLFRDGRQYALRWHRPAASALLQFSDPVGAPLALKPGPTWIQVMRPPEQQSGVEGLAVIGAG